MAQSRVALLALALALPCSAPLRADELELARIYLEQNVTDEDAEVVIVAEGGDEGLQTLKVLGPGRRQVVDLLARRSRALGFREILLETPEPGLDEVLAAYPAGVYRFAATDFSGAELTGSAVLDHAMPAPATILAPTDGAEVGDGLVIEWAAVPGVAGYLLEVEQDDLGQSIQLTLPPATTSFAVPAGWLAAGVEYELGVATVHENGNVSFREIAFTTAD